MARQQASLGSLLLLLLLASLAEVALAGGIWGWAEPPAFCGSENDCDDDLTYRVPASQYIHPTQLPPGQPSRQLPWRAPVVEGMASVFYESEEMRYLRAVEALGIDKAVASEGRARAILELSADAILHISDVKAAYKALARKYHPDKVAAYIPEHALGTIKESMAKLFVRIDEAYKFLVDIATANEVVSEKMTILQSPAWTQTKPANHKARCQLLFPDIGKKSTYADGEFGCSSNLDRLVATSAQVVQHCRKELAKTKSTVAASAAGKKAVSDFLGQAETVWRDATLLLKELQVVIKTNRAIRRRMLAEVIAFGKVVSDRKVLGLESADATKPVPYEALRQAFLARTAAGGFLDLERYPSDDGFTYEERELVQAQIVRVKKAYTALVNELKDAADVQRHQMQGQFLAFEKEGLPLSDFAAKYFGKGEGGRAENLMDEDTKCKMCKLVLLSYDESGKGSHKCSTDYQFGWERQQCKTMAAFLKSVNSKEENLHVYREGAAARSEDARAEKCWQYGMCLDDGAPMYEQEYY